MLRDRLAAAQYLDEVLDLLTVHFWRAGVRLLVKATDFSTVDERVLLEGLCDELALVVVDVLAPLALEEVERLRLVVVLEVHLVEYPTVVRTEVPINAHVIILGHLSN